MGTSIKDLYANKDTMNVQAPGKESNILFKVPEGKDKALIVKFLVDPRGNGRSYVPVKHYPHMIGPNPDQHTRSHISQKSLGNTEDPELDARIGYYKELKQLRETGSQNVARIAVLTKLVEKCKDKESGWFFIVEPGSSVVKAIRLGTSVINSLFGRVYKDKDPIPSLLKEINKQGLSPYDFTSDKAEYGWLKIYSTGQKLGKKYHVELAQEGITKVVDGESFTRTVPARYPLADKIKNLDLTLEDFPDPLEVERKSAFTMEETHEFIESAYTKVPARLMSREGGYSAPVARNSAPEITGGFGGFSADDGVTEINEDELPF